MKDEWQRWLARDPDGECRDELQALIDAGDELALAARFSSRLQFGTAGLRGVVGAGPARMNRLVVRETSAGLGSYLLQRRPHIVNRSIVLGFDGRTHSRQFARDAACVFAGLGIRVYLSDTVVPTPLVAFAVLHYRAAAGVVITASHNPPEYNGYKLFWDNGAQIIPPQDAGIAAAIDVAARSEIPWRDYDAAVAEGNIVPVGETLKQAYVAGILENPLYAPGSQGATSVAYTAMHGVGAELAERLLGAAGFSCFYSVPEQREPDGNFPTVRFPNPEEPGAMDRVVSLAREQGASLACANDPDADRLAVAVRTENGDYQMLSGDMIGVLLGDYALRRYALCSPRDCVPIVCSSIVSSGMLEQIAAAAGADYHATLTGFKWLANTALAHEDEQHRFLFAYEEALGYALGRQVMDKDGLSALLAFVQLTDSLATEGKTVLDQLESLYRQYGLFVTRQISMALEPGTTAVGTLLRRCPPQQLSGRRVLCTEDFGSGQRCFADSPTEKILLPRSDVLIYRLENGARVIVRPSGTEPKLKCYYELVEKVADSEPFSLAQQRADSALQELIEQHQSSLKELLGGTDAQA
jgi:phosphomannomutase